MNSQPLWPEGAPGAVGKEEADRPDLTFFPAKQSKGAGVLICPGGGYQNLATGHEGQDIAAWLNVREFDAWMLRYRLGPRYRHPAQLEDARRAVEIIRASNRVRHLGVWGFSAGGHLAALLATEPDVALEFAILSYPVITLEDPFTHGGSRGNLLGTEALAATVTALSAHYRVTEKTPPTFLFHTGEDTAVPVENSLLFYSALRRHGVPAELHVYESGPHGVGLAPADPVLSSWSGRLQDWLTRRLAGF